tara:strand:+ start:143 stop:268 length:126 start_codon:yes stop_codon:yes gene_type:complete
MTKIKQGLKILRSYIGIIGTKVMKKRGVLKKMLIGVIMIKM